jgi:hypothetical protein
MDPIEVEVAEIVGEPGLVSTLGSWLLGFFLTYLLFWVVSRFCAVHGTTPMMLLTSRFCLFLRLRCAV